MGQGNILIVEDNDVVALEMKSYLIELGFNVIGILPTIKDTYVGDIKLDNDFSFNTLSSQLIYNGGAVKLSKKERLLLKLFMSRVNQLISNETLEYEIWSEQPPNDSRRRTLVSRLRAKLDHRFIVTYASEGYVFHLDT